MVLNPFFTQGTSSEQNLVQDLINEQLRTYGVEIFYIPRKFVTEKSVIREVVQSKFDLALPLEAYVDNYDQYSGCLLYTSPSPRDISGSRMPSSA